MLSSPIPSKAFREFVNSKEHGPAFDSDEDVWNRYFAPSFDPSYKRWNGTRGRRNGLGYEFDFEIGLVSNKGVPNAICDSDAGGHFISVYHTVSMCLLEFFFRLLSSKRVLPNIGTTDDEIEWEDRGYVSPPGFAVMRGEATIKHIDDLARIFGPQCPIRRQTALDLYKYALHFIIEHEMGHAVSGHVHYVKQQLGLKSIDEAALRFSSVNPANQGKVFSHLEGLADKGSYFTVISAPILDRMYAPMVGLSSGDTGLIDETHLKILAGAFLAVFWMISDIVDKNGDMNAYKEWYDHPSSLARGIAFTLMPSVQTEALPPEIGFFVKKATLEAGKELIRLSDVSGYFKPFRWLVKEDMYSAVFKQKVTTAEEASVVNEQLALYRYLAS
jgi:hypothetical protein